MTRKSIMKAYRFARQFGKACGDYDLVNNAGADQFLVPVDHDIPHQALLWWLHYKSQKMNGGMRTTSVHFYDTDDPNPATVGFLTQFCQSMASPLVLRKIPPGADRVAYGAALVGAAVELGCNKVALPDTLDWINGTTLMNMALEGVYDGPAISETVRLSPEAPEVRIVRPFCLVPDAEFAAFAESHHFTEAPTGVRIADDPYIERAKQAFEILNRVNPGTNASNNFFRSQFRVAPKHLGTGEERALAEI
jgi:tRNA(Ile)-lysidine synthase TilS/MesJ